MNSPNRMRTLLSAQGKQIRIYPQPVPILEGGRQVSIAASPYLVIPPSTLVTSASKSKAQKPTEMSTDELVAAAKANLKRCVDRGASTSKNQSKAGEKSRKRTKINTVPKPSKVVNKNILEKVASAKVMKKQEQLLQKNSIQNKTQKSVQTHMLVRQAKSQFPESIKMKNIRDQVATSSMKACASAEILTHQTTAHVTTNYQDIVNDRQNIRSTSTLPGSNHQGMVNNHQDLQNLPIMSLDQFREYLSKQAPNNQVTTTHPVTQESSKEVNVDHEMIEDVYSQSPDDNDDDYEMGLQATELLSPESSPKHSLRASPSEDSRDAREDDSRLLENMNLNNHLAAIPPSPSSHADETSGNGEVSEIRENEESLPNSATASDSKKKKDHPLQVSNLLEGTQSEEEEPLPLRNCCRSFQKQLDLALHKLNLVIAILTSGQSNQDFEMPVDPFPLLPALPLKTKEELLEFDALLAGTKEEEDPENPTLPDPEELQSQFMSFLVRTSADNVDKLVDKMFRKIMTNKLSDNCTWVGRKPNKLLLSEFFFVKTVTAVIYTKKKLNPKPNDELIFEAIQEWLRRSSDRLKQDVAKEAARQRNRALTKS